MASDEEETIKLLARMLDRALHNRELARGAMSDRREGTWDQEKQREKARSNPKEEPQSTPKCTEKSSKDSQRSSKRRMVRGRKTDSRRLRRLLTRQPAKSMARRKACEEKQQGGRLRNEVRCQVDV